MVDEEMRKALICLLKRFNGRWKVSDFPGLIFKWEEENKLMVDEYNINWIYNPKLYKKLNAITIKTKTRKSGRIEGWINMTKKEKMQFINGYIIGFFISGIIIFAVFGYMGVI